MILYRLSIDSVLENYRATGGNIIKCLVIGHNLHGNELYNEIIKHPELGYRCDGVYSFSRKTKLKKSVPHLGYFIDLSYEKIMEYDRIFFSQKLNKKTQEKIINIADDLNLKVSSIPDLAFYDIKNFFISKISNVPYISINKLPLDNTFNIFLKRTFDIVFSFLVITLILSWLTPLFGLIIKISSKGLGVALVIEKSNLKGIFTDGDLRRALNKKIDLLETPISKLMSKKVKTVTESALATEAIKIMQQNQIYSLVVLDGNNKPKGLIRMHDLVEAGIV